MKRKITLPKGVEIAETRIVFTQSSDSCQNDDLPQQIEIFTKRCRWWYFSCYFNRKMGNG
jgi:hypothetical protein